MTEIFDWKGNEVKAGMTIYFVTTKNLFLGRMGLLVPTQGIVYTESDRFNFMLSNMATHLPYKQLIDNEKKEIKWFDSSFINQSVEVKQGSLGFPNENAGGNIQE